MLALFRLVDVMVQRWCERLKAERTAGTCFPERRKALDDPGIISILPSYSQYTDNSTWWYFRDQKGRPPGPTQRRHSWPVGSLLFRCWWSAAASAAWRPPWRSAAKA